MRVSIVFVAGGRRLYIDNDGVICVDQIVGRIGEHGFHLALVRPGCRRIVSDVYFGSDGGLPGGEASPSSAHLASSAAAALSTASSNTSRKMSLSRKRPCRFFENVE